MEHGVECGPYVDCGSFFRFESTQRPNPPNKLDV